MVFHCSDKETADWLRAQDYWELTGLRTLEEKDFPKSSLMVGYFKQSATLKTDTILGCIEAQNRGLPATRWVLKARKDEVSLAILTLEVDYASTEWLKAKNFTVDFGMGQLVRLRLAKNDRPKPKEQQDSAKGEDKKTAPEGDGKTQQGKEVLKDTARPSTSLAHPGPSTSKVPRSSKETPLVPPTKTNGTNKGHPKRASKKPSNKTGK
jgi:hypothetical protein